MSLVPQDGPISVNEWPYLVYFGRDFRPILNDIYISIIDMDIWCYLKIVETHIIIDSQFAYLLRQHKNILKYDLSDAEFIIGLKIMIQIAKRGWKYFILQYQEEPDTETDLRTEEEI